jgi:hypothetical protein
MAHCAGVCSAVGAHGWNISKWCRLFLVVWLVRFPLWGVPGTLCCGGELVRVAHCWVLRQQDRCAAMRDRGGCFWFFLPVPCMRRVVSVSFAGVGPGVWGVRVGVVV